MSEIISPSAASPLPKSFYERPTHEVARDLLGRQLWRRSADGSLSGGTLVEVEAYLGPDDPASHAFRRTPRSEIMYGPAGLAYVYRTYGIHFCANVICEGAGKAGAALLRALEPVEGIERMAGRRGPIVRRGRGAGGQRREDINLRALCSGPAKLTQSLDIGLELNGADLSGPHIWLTEGRGRVPDSLVAVTTRIGVTRAVDVPARYIVQDSAYLSRQRSKRSSA